MCASNEKSANVARKRTPEEAAQERAQAAEARERALRSELAALKSERAAPPPAAATGIGGPVVRSADVVVDKSGAVECQRARRNLETSQSAVTQGSDHKTAALIDIEAACGIDASKYKPKPKEKQRPGRPMYDQNGRACYQLSNGALSCTGS